jgi:3-oxoacyl-[acyl-carrier-protein] synthase-3
MIIVSTGSYLPERVLHNRNLERTLDTSDEWIFERTGIRERRVAASDEATSDICLRAAERALADAVVGASELDLILVTTITPDTMCPSAACWLQAKLGADRAYAFDLAAACWICPSRGWSSPSRSAAISLAPPSPSPSTRRSGTAGSNPSTGCC